MNACLQQLQTQFDVIWRALSAKRTTACLVVALALLGGSVAWSTNRQWEPLYANLDPADAAKIKAELDRAGVAYQLEGGQILVARQQVPAVRLGLSNRGAQPRGGLVGFEILNNLTLGTLTAEEKKVAHQRALAGEIARGLKTIAGVADADVKICIPEGLVTDGEEQQVTASVILALSSENISEQQVRTAIKFVAGSVPGLKEENISMCDQRMRVLTPENGDGPELGAIAPAGGGE